MDNSQSASISVPPFRPALESYNLDYGIGIIGLGGVASRFHLPAYKFAKYNVVGVADVDEDALAAARANGIRRVVKDYRELLSTEGVDILDVTVGHDVPGLRMAIVREAAAAGKHVLMQKPLASTLDEARRMVDVAEDAGIHLAVNQNARFGPACYAVKQLISPDYLGSPGIIEIKNLPNQRIPLQLGPKGMFLEWSIHHADLLRWWAGATAVSAYAVMKHGSCVITYEFENGVVASDIEIIGTHAESETPIRVWAEKGSLRANHRWNPWGGGWKGEFVHVSFTAHADRLAYVSIALPGEHPWGSDAEPVYDYCAPIGGFIGIMGEFMQAIHESRPAATNARDNLQSLAMFVAAEKSARTGRPENPASLL